MGLYTVTVEYEMVVYAASEASAEVVARNFSHEAHSDISTYDMDMNIRKFRKEECDLDLQECIAYGSDKTIKELLAEDELSLL